MKKKQTRTALGTFALVGLISCGKSPSKPTDPATSSTGAPIASAAQANRSQTAAAKPSAWPIPVGVSLAILPGKGVGPIRFGATVPTIERLMGRECEVKTETLCGYNGRAVDFDLRDGKAVKIRISRTFRQNLQLTGAIYGMFNGGFVNGIRLEMLKDAVVEAFGAPKRVEPVNDLNPWNTVERDVYDDMTLEYDHIDSGNIVLGGVTLEPAEVGK